MEDVERFFPHYCGEREYRTPREYADDVCDSVHHEAIVLGNLLGRKWFLACNSLSHVHICTGDEAEDSSPVSSGDGCASVALLTAAFAPRTSNEEKRQKLKSLLNNLRAMLESGHREGRFGSDTYNNPLKLYKECGSESWVAPLFPVIKAILSVPCTSAPAECVFSTAGNVVTKRRAYLDPINVRDSVLVVENVHLFESDEAFCQLVARELKYKL